MCDQCCSNLFDRTAFARRKALAWIKRQEQYVKRAGFTLMATLAVHDKEATDGSFLKLMPHIKRGSTDNRNYVKKAVNWALRQIGKRNPRLRKHAIRTAEEISLIDCPSARWIAADALRELKIGTSKLSATGNNTCGCGGTGRRLGFRNQGAKARESSTLSVRTIYEKNN